jgi:hypothetical protein
VTVALEPPQLRNFRRATPADLARVELKTTTEQNVLRLGLTNARAGNLETHWTIQLPARFSARVGVHVITARVSVGDVTVRIG